MLSQPELDTIVKYFFSLPPDQRSQTNHFDFDRPGKPTLFVKYGHEDLLDEANTQSFFYDLAQTSRTVRLLEFLPSTTHSVGKEPISSSWRK
jgi:hypothetical protein